MGLNNKSHLGRNCNFYNNDTLRLTYTRRNVALSLLNLNELNNADTCLEKVTTLTFSTKAKIHTFKPLYVIITDYNSLRPFLKFIILTRKHREAEK